MHQHTTGQWGQLQSPEHTRVLVDTVPGVRMGPVRMHGSSMSMSLWHLGHVCTVVL